MHAHVCILTIRPCSPPDNWNVIERSTFIYMKNRLVPYPFQANFNALDPADQLACINGLVDAHALAEHKLPKPASLDEWIMRTMGTCAVRCLLRICLIVHAGKGIADLYMRPYNFKVWATPTTMLSADWLGDKVMKPIDLKATMQNVIMGRRTPAPKAVFRFPKASVVFLCDMREYILIFGAY
jgi:protoporphyrinogen oxidase